MYSIALLTLSFGALINAIPQAPAPEAAKGAAPKGGAPKGGAKGGLAGLAGLGSMFSTPAGADGPDMRGLADFLKNPSTGKTLGSLGIPGIDALWKVPDIQKYAPSYLDFRNMSQLPFIVMMPNGPAPTGCSPYEMLIGMFHSCEASLPHYCDKR
jgi:hypothetical protein